MSHPTRWLRPPGQSRLEPYLGIALAGWLALAACGQSPHHSAAMDTVSDTSTSDDAPGPADTPDPEASTLTDTVLETETLDSDVAEDSGDDVDGQADTLVPANQVVCGASKDRIDPQVAQDWSSAQFEALGAARAGTSALPRCKLPSTAKSFHVSAQTGDDANPGTPANPWRTLQHAADSAGPGATVWVGAGSYEGFEIRSSGHPDGLLVFRAADTDTPPKVVGGPGRTALIDIDASWVVISGFDIGDHDTGSLSDDAIGINIEPRNGDIEGVFILNNRVHHIGPPEAGGDACYYNAHGIIAQSEGHQIADLVIDGNALDHLYVGHSECLVVNGNVRQFAITNNYVHDVNNIAIDVIGYEKVADETARFGTVTDNVILDASNYWPYCTRGNCTYPAGDESSDGIYVDGGADLEIAYNVVGRTDHGIELQSENGELVRDVQVHHNLVFNSNYKNLTIGPSENIADYDNILLHRDDLADPQLQSCN